MTSRLDGSGMLPLLWAKAASASSLKVSCLLFRSSLAVWNGICAQWHTSTVQSQPTQQIGCATFHSSTVWALQHALTSVKAPAIWLLLSCFSRLQRHPGPSSACQDSACSLPHNVSTSWHSKAVMENCRSASHRAATALLLDYARSWCPYLQSSFNNLLYCAVCSLDSSRLFHTRCAAGPIEVSSMFLSSGCKGAV
jgi:hypothetical protein